MAPEIIQGKSYCGPKVDIFAAGAVLFQILTKTMPWRIPNDSYHNAIQDYPQMAIKNRGIEIDPDALELFMDMTAIDP